VPGGTYRLYGLSVRSPLALRCPRARGAADVSVQRRRNGQAWISDRSWSSRDWFSYRRLSDGSAFVRWRDLSEFVVSPDGAAIQWRRLPRITNEAFRGYLLSQVLSFSLIARGLEPLHGSAVAVDGKVIAFLGDCGLGKSSLTAAFLQAGCPLVTDDLLVLSRRGAGYTVEPGIPSIKLYPRVARRLLGARGAGPRMTPGTAKMVLPVPLAMSVRGPLSLHTLYVLSRGRSVRITPLTPAAAFLEIVRDAFNTVQLDAGRLASQFRFARRLATTARVRLLAYPRRLAGIEQVRDAVLRDCG